jgi:hypothetical protein
MAGVEAQTTVVSLTKLFIIRIVKILGYLPHSCHKIINDNQCKIIRLTKQRRTVNQIEC